MEVDRASVLYLVASKKKLCTTTHNGAICQKIPFQSRSKIKTRASSDGMMKGLFLLLACATAWAQEPETKRTRTAKCRNPDCTEAISVVRALQSYNWPGKVSPSTLDRPPLASQHCEPILRLMPVCPSTAATSNTEHRQHPCVITNAT